MRDRTQLLLVGVAAGIILVVGIIFPEPEVALPSIWALGAAIIFFVSISGWGWAVLREKSPHIFSPGHIASLLQLEPVDSEITEDPTTKKKYRWLLFLHGGVKLFGSAGGGSLGCSIVREDLVLPMKGSQSSLAVWSVGIPHQMNAPPGDMYHDLDELPPKLKKMALRHGLKPSGCVLWFRDPVEDPRDQIKNMEKLNYEHLYEGANQIINKQSEAMKNLMDKMTDISATKRTVDGSYGRMGWRRDERPERREEDGGESRWQ